MKKLYFLFLFASGLAMAQTTPAPLNVCDTNNDGYASFDIYAVIPEILGSLSPADYAVSFHATQYHADYALSPLASPFTNTAPYNQTLYARVYQIATPDNYSVVNVTLNVLAGSFAAVQSGGTVFCLGDTVVVNFTCTGGSAPYIFYYSVNGNPAALTSAGTSASISLVPNLPGTYTVSLMSIQNSSGCNTPSTQSTSFTVVAPAFAYACSDIVIEESPNDGSAIFDLTQNEADILLGQPNANLLYYVAEEDAINQTNPVSDPLNFANTSNPQTIWVRASDNSSGCGTITDFDLFVTDPGVVYIPDAVFKAQLIADGVDTNSDGKIQFSEALAVTEINIDNLGVADLTGIQSFTNLQQLYASDNDLVTADLSGLTALAEVYLNGNQLSNVNVSGAAALVGLYLTGNELTYLDVAGLANLQTLFCNQNLLYALQLEDLPALKNLNASQNNLSSLNLNEFASLETATVTNNPMSSFSVAGASALKFLNCSANQLSSLNVSGLSNLETLSFNQNPLTSVQWSGLANIKEIQANNTGLAYFDLPPSATLLHLSVQGNALGSLDVSGYPALTDLSCGNNSLTALDVSALENLVNLSLPNNSVATLDLNANHDLQYLQAYNNGMELLFVKNGAAENIDNATFMANNLVYICADDEQVAAIQAQVGAETQVNSYCSFTPGGIFNTITGGIKFDLANDGCDAADAAQPYLKLHMSSGTDSADVFTDNLGVYNFYVGQGNYAVSPVFENSYFTASPLVANVNFPALDDSVSTQDFCLTANGVNPDAEAIIFPVIPARPGFDAVYDIVIRNKGNQVLGQNYGVNFFYDENRVDFVSASEAPVSTGSGAVSWNYSDLLPFETRHITVTVHVNAPTDSPSVNIGDILVMTANIMAAGDVDTTDNTNTLNQTVVGSFDPNDKTCLEGDLVSATLIGSYLHYVINFENTGTAPAENITIRDVLDPAKFDVSSVQVLRSSHSSVTKVHGNGVTIVFPTINLDSGGHGNILLRVKTLPSLHEGDFVSNTADIYFDYNFPIQTNTATTTFQSLAVNDPELEAAIQVFPNPVGDAFTIKSSVHVSSIQLFDVQGRLLQLQTVDGGDARMDVSGRQSGLYFVKILTDKGAIIRKLIKQ